MADTTIDELTSYEQDWGGTGEPDKRSRQNPYTESSDSLPFSGLQVQKFIKDAFGSKFGHVTFDGGSFRFYDEEDGTLLKTVPIASYSVTLTTTDAQTFNLLTGATSKILHVTPASSQTSISGASTPYYEDYTWVLAVNTGSGYVTKKSGTCTSGGTIEAEIRDAVSVGANSIRITVTGTESGASRSILFSCTLVSLVMSCSHDWSKAWVQGAAYSLGNIYFSGNIAKTLHVRIDGDAAQTYTQDFTAGASYINVPYVYDLTSRFPSGASASGIHTVEVWMTGEGIETEHTTFNLMCVLSSESLTASLVCLNEIADPVNYENQTLFKFATYRAGSVSISVTAQDAESSYTVVAGRTVTVDEQTKNTFAVNLEIPSEATAGLSVTHSASVTGGNTATATRTVDNSNACPPVAGAAFYMNASLRTNGDSYGDVFRNDAPSPAVSSYPAVMTGFAELRDKWYKDDNDIRCLLVDAGSSVSVPTLLPMQNLSGGAALTIEFKFKVMNVADYNTPVMSFMDTASYNAATTKGVVLFPTQLTVLNSIERETVNQSVALDEERMHHVVIVFHPMYGTSGRNLCRIYVDAMPQKVFEYSGSASWGQNCFLRIGQAATDTCLYMLRYYDSALEPSGVLTNLLNAMTDDSSESFTRAIVRSRNSITDGNTISYALVKQAGMNTMVIETEDDAEIPSRANQSAVGSSLTMEFASHPSWNWTLTGATLEGQGTTSMLYYRWNLRSKNGSGTVFHYADGTTSTKKGWFDGNGNHPQVNRITAKKNVASSPQGHKMGMCGLYNDLFGQLGLGTSLPSGARVSVYQYPAVGFHKRADGSYEFIGLYTIGPDKGDKGTFGYDTETYPSLLSLEGPNHDPLGTRFNHPWVDMAYDATNGTLTFGGEEGWDADCYDDDSITTAAGVLALYASEWKPAYEIAYFCSPYIASLSEAGYADLASLNAAKTTFRAGSTLFASRTDLCKGRGNDMAVLYDSDYNLIYYRNLTEQYEVLQGHNLVTYLGAYLSTQTPTTAQLIAARLAKFRAEASSYWDISSSLYHSCFCEITGAKDNDAKNSYPFKLSSLASGGRWMWRQDDLDSIGPFDNNGGATVEPSAEYGDLNSEGADIFQGSSSVFWTLLRMAFPAEMKTMMNDMVDGLVAIGTAQSIAGSSKWRTVFNVIGRYLWSDSAKYFAHTCYAEDAFYSYIYVWQRYPGVAYNNVYPLTQALGTAYEAERRWYALRVIYVMSKYGVAGFSGTTDDGLSQLEFTPSSQFTFTLTPAVRMYPKGSAGGSSPVPSSPERVAAGGTCSMETPASGTTGFYLKGLDWYSSIGDLSGLVLTSRGGSSVINFSVSAKRLRALKFGDGTAAGVTFNATNLTVQGGSIEEVDGRNWAPSVGGVAQALSPLDLSGCPRLRRVKFAGSSLPVLLLPPGSKVSEASFPASSQTVYLNTLPFLAASGLTVPQQAYLTVTGVFVKDCPSLNPLTILAGILGTTGNVLEYVTAHWASLSGTASDVSTLDTLTAQHSASGGYGRVTYDAETGQYVNSYEKPDLRGILNVTGGAYSDTVARVRAYFTNVTLNVDILYFRFSDAEVERVLKADGIIPSSGITTEGWAQVTSIGVSFRGNTVIAQFPELASSGVTELSSEAFRGCTSLVSVGLPSGLAAIPGMAFYHCTSLALTSLPDGITEIGGNAFNSCTSLALTELPDGVTKIGNGAFNGCTSLAITELPGSVTEIVGYAFNGCIGITSLKVPIDTPPTLGEANFTSSLQHIYVPAASVDAYKAAANWSAFASIIEAIAE